MTDRPSNTTPASRLPHRLATLLVCAVFPLIWVGGLVTSSDAGMAVPDWPSTYGYNLFLYPWTTWFFGPWDVFVEHGHRLLGAAAGFITIALAWSLWRYDERPTMKWLGVAALVAVIAQGVLGGLRVVLDARLLAMTHGCTGPLYFALCVALWHYTSDKTADTAGQAGSCTDGKAFRLAMLTTMFAYLQLVVGAVIRHMPVYAPPQIFHAAVMFHLTLATVLFVEIIVLAGTASRMAALRGGSRLLVALLLIQLALGGSTWIVNYGFPQWVNALVTTPDFVIRAHSLPQLMVTTAHVAVGSLIVVTAMLLSLKAWPSAKAKTAATSSFAGLALREALR